MDKGIYDMGVGQLTITLDRVNRVDFGISLFNRELVFAGSHPKRVDVLNTLILPFHVLIWMALVGTLVFVFLFFILFDWTIGRQRTSNPIFTSLVVTLSPLLNEAQPRRMFHRTEYKSYWMICGMWMIVGYFMSMAYKSNLLATLTIPNYEKSVTTAEEILESGFPLYSLAGTALVSSLKSSPRPIFPKLYEQAILERNGLQIFGQSQAQRDIEIKEGRAFKTTTRVDCLSDPSLRIFPEPYFIGRSAWFFTKGSQVKGDLDKALQRILEAGISNYWKRHFIEKERQGKESETVDPLKAKRHEFKPISISHYQPVLVVGGIGLIFALISFLFELIHWHTYDCLTNILLEF
ncbi:hypothetical protein TCAL_12001 [Tigriopus californicus]|uniref:Ionotropic glutamate receptor C-terminal domain-containing protein n=1 Tax=Tigriopus californicus TaxID=6832 RepID=A0A553P5X3_TIGCA|nr:uncharacterized protein LOC131877507 [Tigriopus californicus]TRY73040.1 hypothetical protein TCAL_12001 [Tigriopus californicus]|eukprot:TCALIF_12001-PA protein Name:"Protein of unknown function" AED:0.29 eAED:0.34 QI:0/-1/0/1/-1/1/1/0/349